MKNNDYQLSDLTEEEAIQIAGRLTTLRNDILHLSQSQCADALGISQTYLSMLESGKRKITDEVVSLYAECFNTNPDWLMTGDAAPGIIKDDSKVDIEYLIRMKQQDVLNTVKATFHLDEAEADALSRFLALEPAKRRRFIKSLKDIKDFM